MLYTELYIGSGPAQSYPDSTEIIQLISPVKKTFTFISSLKGISLTSEVDLKKSTIARIYT